jgi:hypothetical protein
MASEIKYLELEKALEAVYGVDKYWYWGVYLLLSLLGGLGVMLVESRPWRLLCLFWALYQAFNSGCEYKVHSLRLKMRAEAVLIVALRKVGKL